MQGVLGMDDSELPGRPQPAAAAAALSGDASSSTEGGRRGGVGAHSLTLDLLRQLSEGVLRLGGSLRDACR